MQQHDADLGRFCICTGDNCQRAVIDGRLAGGPRGIRVKSPILGVVLLTVSLAFFYLYLVFVYPVTEQF